MKGLLNRFNSEVGVATVYDLEEGDLGVAGKVDVLLYLIRRGDMVGYSISPVVPIVSYRV